MLLLALLPTARFAEGARILFQGDSITDGNRGRNEDPNHILGHGYAFLIAADNGAAHPEKRWTFLNRGISGHKVADLAARWQQDTIDLKPDVISILVGINDVEGGTTPEAFEATYERLIVDTQRALPKARLVLCEPFGLAAGWRKADWATRAATLPAMQRIVADLARRRHATFVPLQKAFDDAVRRAGPAEIWLWDGIHPTVAAHRILADAWTKAYDGAK